MDLLLEYLPQIIGCILAALAAGALVWLCHAAMMMSDACMDGLTSTLEQPLGYFEQPAPRAEVRREPYALCFSDVQ